MTDNIEPAANPGEPAVDLVGPLGDAIAATWVHGLVASEAFVVPLEDPNDPSADEWARLDAANADEDARAEGYRDGFSAAMVGALRDEAKAKAALAEKIAEIAEEAADELDLPVMGEWLDQRDWFKDQLHALAAKAREAGGVS